MKILKALWFLLLRQPQGEPLCIHCPRCDLRHIDKGIWRYRAHSRHLCARCGNLFTRWANGPTRGE